MSYPRGWMRVFIFLFHYRRAWGKPSWSHDHAQEVRRQSTAPATVRYPSKFFASWPPTLPFMETLFLECADDMKKDLFLVSVCVHSLHWARFLNISHCLKQESWAGFLLSDWGLPSFNSFLLHFLDFFVLLKKTQTDRLNVSQPEHRFLRGPLRAHKMI